MFVRNRQFSSKIEVYDKNPNFYQNRIFFFQNPTFCLKTKIFGQSKLLSKIGGFGWPGRALTYSNSYLTEIFQHKQL